MMNAFSSSTSRLILPKRRQNVIRAQPRPLAECAKFASTEGRFTIIDEKRKQSDSVDSDSSEVSDVEQIVCAVANERVTVKCTSASAAALDAPSNFAHSNGTAHMTTSGSRFKIVPVESRYKRGRWACWDCYGGDEVRSPKGAKFATGPLANTSNNNLTVSSQKSLPPASADSTLHRGGTSLRGDRVTFAIDLSDDSDAENSATHTARSNASEALQPPNPPNSTSSERRSVNPMAPSLESPSADAQPNGNHLVPSPDHLNNGRITPSEMLHSFGLERSLSATSYNDKSILDLLPGSTPTNGSASLPGAQSDVSGTGLGPGGTPQMVAIDSKIEQAMDLVKTHLMFAVREEVEVLRAKIIELETTVLQLEAENAVLREHVPADILSKLSLQGNPGGPTAAAAV